MNSLLRCLAAILFTVLIPVECFAATTATPDATLEETLLATCKKFFNEGLYPLAQEKLEALLRSNPQAPLLYDARLLLGRSLYNQKNFSRALQELEAILSETGAKRLEDEALYWSGEIYLKNGDVRRALEAYQKIIDDYPSSRYIGYALYSKGWIYYESSYYEEAIQAFRESAAKEPFEKVAIDAAFKIAECEYILGRYAEASTSIDNFLEKFSLSYRAADAYCLKGEVEFRKEEYAKAVESYESALAIAPGARWVPSATARIARAYYLREDYDKSYSAYRACVQMTDDEIIASWGLLGSAQTLRAKKNNADALEAYEELMVKYPSSDAAQKAFVSKACISFEEGRYDDALAMTAEASRRAPLFADEIGYVIAAIDRYNGKTNAAYAKLTRITHTSQNRELVSFALCGLGDIDLEHGRYREALRRYGSVLTKLPETRRADYAQYQLGTVSIATKKYDQAILAYQSVIVNFQNSALRVSAIKGLGIAHFARRDIARAESEFCQVLGILPHGRERDIYQLYAAAMEHHLSRYGDAAARFQSLGKADNSRKMEEMSRYGRALSLYGLRKDKEAFSEFEAIEKEFRGTDVACDALYWLGEYQQLRGNYALAREYYLAIPREYPGSDMAPKASYQAALTWQEEGKLTEAVDRLISVAAAYPSSSFERLAYRKIAMIEKEAKNYSKATEYFRRALTEDNSEANAMIQYEIAESLEVYGALEGATEEYERVTSRYWKGIFWSIRAQFKRAQLFERLGRREDAIRLYEKLAGMDVDESKYAKRRIGILSQKGNP